MPPPEGGDIYYQSQVFESTDDGAHWAALGVPIDPSVTVSTLEVAPSDPTRLYVSGTRGAGAGITGALFVFTNSAASWTENPVALISSPESGFYIGAVDPTNSDLVYLRTDDQSRLLVTTNAGASFQTTSFVEADGGTATSLVGAIYGFAISPDGSKVYAGGTGGDGLFVGARGAASLVHQADIDVDCLAARAGETAGTTELWACSDQTSGFVVGVFTDDGTSFTPKFQLDQIRRRLGVRRGGDHDHVRGAVRGAVRAPARLCRFGRRRRWRGSRRRGDAGGRAGGRGTGAGRRAIVLRLLGGGRRDGGVVRRPRGGVSRARAPPPPDPERHQSRARLVRCAVAKVEPYRHPPATPVQKGRPMSSNTYRSSPRHPHVLRVGLPKPSTSHAPFAPSRRARRKATRRSSGFSAAPTRYGRSWTRSSANVPRV